MTLDNLTTTTESALLAELSQLADKLARLHPRPNEIYGGWSPGEWARWLKLWANGRADHHSMHSGVPMRDEIIDLIDRIRGLKS